MKDIGSSSIHDHLKHFFGFDTFIGKQEAIIKNLLARNNAFVLMPTGGGKSLCYQLPALMLEGTAIVISPLIALMKNQVDILRNFVGNDTVAHFLNSSLSRPVAQMVREDVLSGKTKLLYVAPESLGREENIAFLSQANISFYAIDEAHCISEWGHDFRPEYRRIRSVIDKLGEAPVLVLTATATPKVQHDIQKNLDMLHDQVFKSSFNRPNLYYEVRSKNNVDRDIIRYIKQNHGKSGIIYCLSRKKVDEIAEILTINGIKALPYHAGLDAAVRSANQDKFLMEEVDVIVATIAFGMGIDKSDVRFVIHYDMPKSLEGYYQETGRAGRDHGEGQCIAFYSTKDIQKLEKLLQGKPQAEVEIGRQLLMEVEAYAASAVCRRKLLLRYFGEEYEQENCGNCDNCCGSKTQFEGETYVLQVLETLVELSERFKSEYVIDILRGKMSSLVKSYHHEDLEIFGVGESKDVRFWISVIRQCFLHQLLDKDVERYGVLGITQRGQEFLEHPHSIMLTEDHLYSDDEDEIILGSSNKIGGDEQLFAMLKSLLHDLSKKLNKPPYLMFADPSLHDMVTQYPITIEELQNCQGVGVGKARKFGQPFVDLIRKYVEEKEIERPQDMVVKSMVNKSANKVFIIQNIDRKMALEDIANAKKMSLDELLSEMETIVHSGTKLNISYYVQEHVDEEKCQDIVDYFMNEAQSESIEQAIADLECSDCSIEEIRLVRIKFLSEHAM